MRIRPSSWMLVILVAVFAVLFIFSEFYKPGESPKYERTVCTEVDSGILAVVNPEGSAVSLRVPNVISFSGENGFNVNIPENVSEEIAVLREKGGEKVRISAVWALTDSDKTDFFAWVSQPAEWIENVSKLTRTLRLKRISGIDMELRFSDYSLDEQDRLLTFLDTFARNLRLRYLTPSLTFPFAAHLKTQTLIGATGADIINPDPSILPDIAITTDGNAEATLQNEKCFFPSLAAFVDQVIILGIHPDSAVDLLKGFPIERTAAPGVYDTVSLRLVSADGSKLKWAETFALESLPVLAPPAGPLSDEESAVAAELNAVETKDHHLRLGGILINRSAGRLEIPAMLNLSSGLVEVVMCDPQKGRVHESLLVSKVRPFDLQLALYLLGLKNGTPENSDSSIPRGDRVKVAVLVHGGRGSVPLQNWITREQKGPAVADEGFIFVGSGFREKRCLADDSGNQIDINSLDDNTVLLMADSAAADSVRYYANTTAIPRYIGDAFPVPSNEMSSQPMRPEVPVELEIPVTVYITPVKE